ncbi:MAG TPA: hypothetical protein GXX62_07330 [Alcaligenaceae bacterium]|nr:hypothetical protein [Alcaligenaceae bacterium]
MKEQDESIKKQLSTSDAELVRVLEDLIDVLIANGTIRMTDLPPKALEKLTSRKQTRRKLNNSLNLLGDDEDSII